MRRLLTVTCVTLVVLSAASVLLGRRPHGVTVAYAATAASRCGTDAWAVKTLSDPAALRVDLVPEATTVTELAARRAPAVLGTRLPGAEMHTWRVHVRLLWQRLEDDLDIHLVVADPRTGATLIAELPAPSCVGAAARPYADMAAARETLARYCGPATTRFARLHGTATIDGVAFFDFVHNQRGVARNGIELHPVLKLSPGPGRC